MLPAVLVLLRAETLIALVLLRVILLAQVVVITVALLDALVLLRVAPVLLLSRVVLPVVLPAVVVWTPMQMCW